MKHYPAVQPLSTPSGGRTAGALVGLARHSKQSGWTGPRWGSRYESAVPWVGEAWFALGGSSPEWM